MTKPRPLTLSTAPVWLLLAALTLAPGFSGPAAAQDSAEPTDSALQNRNRARISGSLGLPSHPRLGQIGTTRGRRAYELYQRQIIEDRLYLTEQHLHRWIPRYRDLAGTLPYPGVVTPWIGIPQSLKLKDHHDVVSVRPALGLQHLYDDSLPPAPVPGVPASDHQGLRLSDSMRNNPEIEEEVARPQLFPGSGPVVETALSHIRRGNYSRAGLLLASEVKNDSATLPTYVAIAEVLSARKAFKGAARVLYHGLDRATSLSSLDGVNVSTHFPSPEVFTNILTGLDREIAAELEARGEDPVVDGLSFLRATLGLLSGEPSAMKALESLQDSPTHAEPATRLYLHFIDRLLVDRE